MGEAAYNLVEEWLWARDLVVVGKGVQWGDALGEILNPPLVTPENMCLTLKSAGE